MKRSSLLSVVVLSLIVLTLVATVVLSQFPQPIGGLP
jgi:hypothetical protein